MKDWNQLKVIDLGTGVVTTYSCDCLEPGALICDVGGDNKRVLDKHTTAVRVDTHDPELDHPVFSLQPPSVFDMLNGEERPCWLLGFAFEEVL